MNDTDLTAHRQVKKQTRLISSELKSHALTLRYRRIASTRTDSMLRAKVNAGFIIIALFNV